MIHSLIYHQNHLKKISSTLHCQITQIRINIVNYFLAFSSRKIYSVLPPEETHRIFRFGRQENDSVVYLRILFQFALTSLFLLFGVVKTFVPLLLVLGAVRKHGMLEDDSDGKLESNNGCTFLSNEKLGHLYLFCGN